MSHCVSCLSQEAYELFREWLDLTCWNIKFFEGRPIENIGRAPLVNQDSAHYKVRNLQFDYHGIIVRWIRNAPDVFEMRFLECQTQPFLSDRIPGANRAWRTKKLVLNHQVVRRWLASENDLSQWRRSAPDNRRSSAMCHPSSWPTRLVRRRGSGLVESNRPRAWRQFVFRFWPFWKWG